MARSIFAMSVPMTRSIVKRERMFYADARCWFFRNRRKEVENGEGESSSTVDDDSPKRAEPTNA